MADFFVFKQQIGVREDVAAFQIALALGAHGAIDGNDLLTPTCVTSAEWDHQIGKLIKRLEELRSEGKEFFR
jgi:hypothetical protein